MSEPASHPAGEPAAQEAEVHRFSRPAMACVFEVLIAGRAERAARDAADAAFEELERLEKLLSRFHGYSDVCRINAAPVGEWVIVDLEVEECLLIARRVWGETGRAFDVTAGKPPDPATAPAARGRVGMDLLEFDEHRHAIRRLDAAVRIDLGGIGKGYALDRLAGLLREYGVERALLNSGSSTALALGPPTSSAGWRVALRDPADESAKPLGHVLLAGAAFSGSGTVHARHISDPRTRRAVPGDRAAWAVAPTAAEADALTTALCVMELDEAARYATNHLKASCIIARRQEGRWRLQELGPKVLLAAD